jgi:hypothetical protein
MKNATGTPEPTAVRFVRALFAAVREFRQAWNTPSSFNPTAFYRAQVVRQSSDLLLVDVQTEFPEVGGYLPDVHLATGIPGVRVRLQPGAPVLLSWRTRDARFPEAYLAPSTKAVELVTGPVELATGAPAPSHFDKGPADA